MGSPSTADDMKQRFINEEQVTRERLTGTNEGEHRQAGVEAGRALVSLMRLKFEAASNPIASLKVHWFLTGLTASLVRTTQFDFHLPEPSGDSTRS
jgi:hypothetical protein